jgi:flavin-dependent dehydrogenase
MLGIVHDLNFGYKPPETLNALNVEIRLGNDFIQEKLGNIIYIYNWSTVRGMRVAGIIPKKECITVNLIGEMDMKRDDLNEFLNRFEDHNILPKGWKWSDVICRCAPRVAVTPAKKPYTNRLVIVGDASCSRYYKNGIESAFMTARIAAKTAFELGLSEYAFQKGYFQHIRKNLSRDNLYGRILFKINDLVSGSSLFSKVMLKVAEDEGNKANKKPLRSVLWNMYTGNIPYRTILLKFLSPILQWKLSVATAQLISHRLFLLCSRKEKREK